MSLRDWFASKKKNKRNKQLDANAVNSKLTDEELGRLWLRCYSCNANLPRKEFETNLMMCPQCSYHLRIGAPERIRQLTSGEDDTFEEQDRLLIPADPLSFTDTQKYTDRQKDAHEKTGLNEAVITGIAAMGGEKLALGVMDFTYMGGSMGSVVGEKVTRLIETALEQNLPLIIFSSSGGARMQEGTFSLMQMVKTGAALARFHEKGLFYISVLTEPTFGGVTASFGTLGDILIAEQGSRIGFAGRRVIEQTIRQKLPPDFQTAGYLLNYGQVDMVVPRTALRQRLIDLIRLHRVASGNEPGGRAARDRKREKASSEV